MAALAFDVTLTGPQASSLVGTVNAPWVSFAWQLEVIPGRVSTQFVSAFGGSVPQRNLLLASDYDLPHMGVGNSNGFASLNPIFREDEFLFFALDRVAGAHLVEKAETSTGLRLYSYLPQGYVCRYRALVL